jgi:carbonic anhydrase/acetyltransferase-like protein (isoleucine patch superfamily)
MSATPTETMAEKNFVAGPQGLVESTEIGANIRVWAFAHVMRGARVGANCNIGDHAFIETGRLRPP